MIKCIIFDLGNVVIKVNQDLMFREFSSYSTNTADEIKKAYENSVARKKFERGKINSVQFYDSMKKELSLTVNFNEFRKIYTGIFSHNKETEQFILKLKKKYRMILLSNTDELHYNFIKKKFPILGYFDDFILSYKSGKRKPNPLIFIEAIKKSKTMPWNCIYFDDIKEFVIMARLLGVRAFQYRDIGKLKRNLNKAIIQI